MAYDKSGWLPALLGVLEIIADGGDPVEPRATLNFVGMTAVDDTVNERTDITVIPSTTSAAGTMSATDKAKLDGIQKQGSTTAVSAMAIDWSLSGTFSKTLAAGANTFTFSNATDGQCIIVKVTGAASTLTWPTVLWAGGVAPTQTASGVDIYTFVKIGSDIFGSVVQAMA